jgi:hypothetical protein
MIFGIAPLIAGGADLITCVRVEVFCFVARKRLGFRANLAKAAKPVLHVTALEGGKRLQRPEKQTRFWPLGRRRLLSDRRDISAPDQAPRKRIGPRSRRTSRTSGVSRDRSARPHPLRRLVIVSRHPAIPQFADDHIVQRAPVHCGEDSSRTFADRGRGPLASDGLDKIALDPAARRHLAEQPRIRNPELVLLDEATSSLDPESEEQVIESLRRLIRGRSAIIVTHRLPLVWLADHLLTIDAGRAIDFGPTAEVISASTLVRERDREGQLAAPEGGEVFA